MTDLSSIGRQLKPSIAPPPPWHVPMDARPTVDSDLEHLFILVWSGNDLCCLGHKNLFAHRVVEELLQLFVGVVDAELLEAVDVKDLKSGNVEDADERGALALGAVQGPVDPRHDPLEEALEHGLGDGLHGKLDLFLKIKQH
jgi:hypothetical protein